MMGGSSPQPKVKPAKPKTLPEREIKPSLPDESPFRIKKPKILPRPKALWEILKL